MIVPSIDIRGGRAVQLIGGREQALDGGDPLEVAERFGRVGPLAVIDLDAALGTGNNTALIRQLCARYRCRVGGGIRSVEAALDWLDAGADRVILGTAARPEILRQLPADRVIAALDAEHGEVVVEGWRTRTGATITERMEALAGLAGGFLVTFVEREGRLGGTSLDRAAELKEVAGDAELTIAGGVTTAEEVAALDRLGADAQVGMALYTGRLGLSDAFAAPLISDRTDGLWPTVIVDEQGVALGLAYSDSESLTAAIERGRGVYRSRKRGLWEKGATSGASQDLVRVEADCDRDTLRFVVRQAAPGFCHEATRTCWGNQGGIAELARTLERRKQEAPEGSYTARLFADRGLLGSKLREEADELARAEGAEEVAWEVADVLYFALAAAVAQGVDLGDVEAELDRRARTVRRRDGSRKGVA
jgi:phosphoribosyl-AMP cyclohydrolase / phosphoribosyl-ATP pyrophosphohydrolase